MVSRDRFDESVAMNGLLPVLLLAGFLTFPLSCRHMPSEADNKQAMDSSDAAKSLLANGQYREALRELFDAEKLDPNNCEVQYLLASVYFFGFQRHVEATDHIERALKHSKESYPEAENLYGVILLDQGKINEAIVYLERAAKNLLYSTPYFAQQNLGDAYTRLGKLEDANLQFKSALVAQPDLCGAYLPLAQNLRSLQKNKEAEGVLHSFLKTCDAERLQKFIPMSMTASVYYELGLIRLELNNKKGAREIFNLCSQRFDDDMAQKCISMLNRLN